MMRGVIDSQALGLVHRSGWMTSENFLKVLEYMVKHTRCSKDKKILLIMDNHDSHLSVEGIDYCKDNGIVILTLHPHTSHKMQPLDRTVFGPFKMFLSAEMDSWMLSHPGQVVQIYDIPKMALTAWDRAATPENIKSGFRCTGIFPYDRNVFKEQDFLSSSVSDRPINENATAAKTDTTDTENNLQILDTDVHKEDNGQPSTSTNIAGEENRKTFVKPEDLLPYPKAKPRVASRRGPPKRKSIVATDTPERDAIAAQKNKKVKIDQTKITKATRKVFEDSSDESEDDWQEDPSDDELQFSDDDEIGKRNVKDLEIGTFLIVKVSGKCSVRNYVADIIKKETDGYTVQFMKRHFSSFRFTTADEPPAFVSYDDILYVLPPGIKDKRKRFYDKVYFNVDLSEFCIF